MKCTLFLMTICQPERISWLIKNIEYLEEQKFPFVRKTIFADEFNGWTFPVYLKRTLQNIGYEVFIDNHKSRIKSMDRAFSVIDSDWIFYNEEDVLSTLPSFKDIQNVSNLTSNGRSCGMVSLTLGGSTNHFPAGQYGDLKEAKNNILYQTDNWFAFKRLEEYKNNWFFEFPGLFVKTDIFKSCHNGAKEKFNSQQVEIGLTNSYFYQKLNEEYFKCSIAKNNFFELIESENPVQVFNKSRLLENLDPQQGCSPFGGVHIY